MTAEDGFRFDMTPDELKAAVSKFASPGLHVAEASMPEWENVGTSIRFPFAISEEGPDNGKEGKIVTGVDKKSAWKLNEILNAFGIEAAKSEQGTAMLTSKQAMSIAGKSVKVLFKQHKDARSLEEGGTGTVYTKADSFHSMETTEKDLGI